jgi:hypothetical protein
LQEVQYKHGGGGAKSRIQVEMEECERWSRFRFVGRGTSRKRGLKAETGLGVRVMNDLEGALC